VDLIDFQVGKGDIPYCQVGKGEEMSSLKSSLTDEEAEGTTHSYEDSCGTVSRMNEDDEKLQTSITEKGDRKTILIIGGFEIFIPSDRGEASTDVAKATEGQSIKTVMEETKYILMSVPMGGEEHSTESLDLFSQKVEQGMTAALEPAEEVEEDNIEFVGLSEELESLERRMVVKGVHIQ
jgi:hypothetical protein